MENIADTALLDVDNCIVMFRRRYEISEYYCNCASRNCARAFKPRTAFSRFFLCAQRRRNTKCAQDEVNGSTFLKIKAFFVKECPTLKRLITTSDATHPEWWSLAAQR